MAKKTTILNNKSNFLLLQNKPLNIDTKKVSGVGLVHCKDIENGFFSTNIAFSRNIVLCLAKETNTNEYDLLLG